MAANRSGEIENMTFGMPNTVRIVDCHGHLGYFSGTRIIPTDADTMIRVMDRVGVEKICISSFLSIGPDYKQGNNLVGAALKKYPDRFIGYGVVNPNSPQ